MNTLSDEQLVELEGLYQKATPGPWHGYSLYSILRFARKNSGPWEDCPDGHNYPSEDDSDLILAMYDAFPSLLSTIQSLRTELDEARDDSEELRKIKDYLWPNQTGMPNEHRNAHIAIEARHRLMMAAKEKAEQESESLRTELAAAKEDLALTKFRLKAADQGLQELDEENARFRAALTEIASYDKEKKHGDGICPYGCDTPFIAQRVLSQPPQSPWRPIAEAPKDGTTLLLYPSRFTLNPCVGFYNSLSGHWVAETDTAWPTHWMPLPQPPTKGEES